MRIIKYIIDKMFGKHKHFAFKDIETFKKFIDNRLDEKHLAGIIEIMEGYVDYKTIDEQHHRIYNARPIDKDHEIKMRGIAELIGDLKTYYK